MNILITGGSGLLGKALIDAAKSQNISCYNPTSKELNLLDFGSVKKYLADCECFDGQGIYSKFSYAIHLAAKVGGVKANSYELGSFYSTNININVNFLQACLEHSIPKVVSVLSTCVYPDAPYVSYPLTEDQLHLGPPHDSNFGYA